MDACIVVEVDRCDSKRAENGGKLGKGRKSRIKEESNMTNSKMRAMKRNMLRLEAGRGKETRIGRLIFKRFNLYRVFMKEH